MHVCVFCSWCRTHLDATFRTPWTLPPRTTPLLMCHGTLFPVEYRVYRYKQQQQQQQSSSEDQATAAQANEDAANTMQHKYMYSECGVLLCVTDDVHVLVLLSVFVALCGRLHWVFAVLAVIAYLPSYLNGDQFRGVGRPWEAFRKHPVWYYIQGTTQHSNKAKRHTARRRSSTMQPDGGRWQPMSSRFAMSHVIVQTTCKSRSCVPLNWMPTNSE